jgi:hypothetical protein
VRIWKKSPVRICGHWLPFSAVPDLTRLIVPALQLPLNWSSFSGRKTLTHRECIVIRNYDGVSFRWKLLKKRQISSPSRRQGDQIGRILAQWVIAYFGQLFWELEK